MIAPSLSKLTATMSVGTQYEVPAADAAAASQLAAKTQADDFTSKMKAKATEKMAAAIWTNDPMFEGQEVVEPPGVLAVSKPAPPIVATNPPPPIPPRDVLNGRIYSAQCSKKYTEYQLFM